MSQFVGRARELAALREVVDRAGRGMPRMVVLSGETGVGKTRVISELVDDCRLRGAKAVVGHCVPVARGGLPYAPAREAIRHLSSVLGSREVEDLAGWAPREFASWIPMIGQRQNRAAFFDNDAAQTKLFEFLLDLLGWLGKDAPLLFAVEDVHWADRPTLDLLAFLVRNMRREAVAVVVSYRDDELCRAHPLRSWLAELRRNSAVEMLSLGRLNRDETADQLAGILGLPLDGLVIDGIFARSEGNPFFTEELAWAMTTDGDQCALPARTREMLLARVHALSVPARSVLDVAAAAGLQVNHELLSRVAAIPEDRLLVAVREAVDYQLLVPHPEDDSYRFRHALIQEATYSELLPRERRRLHEALARILASHPDLAGGDQATAYSQVAHHWYAARNLPAALDAALRAGQAAERAYAFAEASRQFERATELWDVVPRERLPAGAPGIVDHAGVFERAAEAAKLAGEHDRAVMFVQQAMRRVDDRGDPVRAGLLHARLGTYLFDRGDEAAASQACRRALRLVPVAPPSAERAQALVATARLSLVWGRYHEARATSRAAIEMARAAKALGHEGHALRTLGLVTGYEGNFDLGIDRVRQALSIAEETRDANALASGYIDLCQLLIVADRLEEATQLALQTCHIVGRLGLEPPYRPLLETNAASALFELGRWEEAGRLVASATQRKPDGRGQIGALMVSSDLAIARGDFPFARQQLDHATDFCRNVHTPTWHRRLCAQRAELAVWQGRLEEAAAEAAQGLRLCARNDERRLGTQLLLLGLRAQADRAELAHARQDDSEAASARRAGRALREGLGQLILDRAPETPVWPADIALTVTVEAEESRLDGHSDPRLWAAAVAHWDELARPYRAAYARLRLSEALLASRGTRAHAAPVLRQAHEVGRRLGAEPLRRALERLSRWARIDLQQTETPRHDRAPARPGPADEVGLTTREREVLQHLAAGRSNRQIAQALYISRSTASVHVSHILAKLGASSRVEAASFAYRLGIIDHA